MADVNEKSFEMEDASSFVEQELEALQSIYIDEIEVKHEEEKFTSVSIDLYPATADNHDEQYVRMTLKFILNEEYPRAVPEISIRNPRGLSEEKLNSIMQDLTSIAESKIGNSMLFEIIEAAKEHLTNENRPCGECAICLYGFSDDDVFTKTECYHYFHSHCLARYVKNASAENTDEANHSDTPPDKKILCPMCRLPIQFEGPEELYPPPSAKDDDFEIDGDVLALQKKMADLYQKQLEKGGIIDIEAEKNKYLLEISNVPTRVNAVEKSSPSSTVDDTDSIPETDPSSKTDENACGDSQTLPKDKVSGSKDSRTDSKNRNKPDSRPRNDRYGYNKQPRNNANRNNSYRGNQRYNRYPKPNARNFNRKGNGAYAAEDLDFREEQYAEDENNSPQNKHKNVGDHSEDSHDASPVSESSPGNSHPQRKNERANFSDSKKYSNDRKGSDYRPNSNRGRRYGQNNYERRGYRGNQQESKSSPSKNDAFSKNDMQNEVTRDDVSVPESNICENSSESVSEHTVAANLAEKQEGVHKNFDKTQENRPRYSNTHNRKNSYRNWDSDANYYDDNAQSQEGRKDFFRRGKPGRGYRNNNYNDRQSYRENNYHSQDNRYPQENTHKRNFSQQSRQGDRHSQEKNSYSYEGRRDYNKNRSNGRSAHDGSNRKFSSDDRYDNHERENSHKFTSDDRHDYHERENSRKFTPDDRHDYHERENNRKFTPDDSHDYHERENSRKFSSDDTHDRENGHKFSSDDRYDYHERENNPQGNVSRKPSYRNQREEQYDDVESNYVEKGNRYNGKNRNDYHYQNRDQNSRGNRNNRYEKNYSSYQNNRGTSRKYAPRKYGENSDSHYHKSDERTKSESQFSPESSENHASEKQFSPDSVCTKVSVPKTEVSRSFASEIPFNKAPNVPDMKTPVSDSTGDVMPQKSVRPPPGFNNPLKKVVYGLQAANPPPGFPRS